MKCYFNATKRYGKLGTLVQIKLFTVCVRLATFDWQTQKHKPSSFKVRGLTGHFEIEIRAFGGGNVVFWFTMLMPFIILLSPNAQVQEERDKLYERYQTTLHEVQQKAVFRNVVLKKKTEVLTAQLEKKVWKGIIWCVGFVWCLGSLLFEKGH